MNEQIRELAKQAGLSYLYDYDADGHAMVCSEKDIEKFAELIVRESMKVTKDYTCNQGWDYSAPVALARHFGVE